MKVVIHHEAKRDLIDGFWFYERQEAGLGNYYIDSLYADIDSLQLYGGIHAKHFGKYYRMLALRFPYAIYYVVEDKQVIVMAILDCRRRMTKSENV